MCACVPPCVPVSSLQITTDVVALLDEWAARFFEELDYVKEGQNATIFAQQMAQDLPQVYMYTHTAAAAAAAAAAVASYCPNLSDPLTLFCHQKVCIELFMCCSNAHASSTMAIQLCKQIRERE